MRQVLQRFICSVILATGLGCGLTNTQIVKTRSFGNATAHIGQLGEEEFVNIRVEIIEMKTQIALIDSGSVAGDLNFDKPVSAEDVAARVAASKALKLYGELLVKLVTEDRTEGLQKAANSLLENTTAALQTDLTDEKKNAINKIIVGLGSFWITKKKADAAKKIIPAYQGPIDILADLLHEDFSLADDANGFLKGYQTIAKRLKNASIRELRLGVGGDSEHRIRSIRSLAMAEKAISRAKEIDEKAGVAITKLKKANVELVKVIKKEQYATDDIKSYANQIRELINMYEVVTQ